MPLIRKTVVGTLLDYEEEPAAGTLVFDSPYTLKDTTGDIVYTPTTIKVSLANGTFTVELAATNSPDITPSGWTWRITEVISGKPRRTWYTQIAHDATEPIDYTDLVPVETPPEVGAFATVDQLNAEASTRAAADSALDARLDAAEPAIAANASGITAEATARANADAALDGRVDDLEAATAATVTTDTPQTITAAKTLDAPDVATTLLKLLQDNAVTSTDANLLEVLYLGFNTLRLNELGLLRVIVPPASSGLGKHGEIAATLQAGTSTSKALRVNDHLGVENAYILGNGTASFSSVSAPNINKGAWTDIVIDSPTSAGRYNQSSGTAPNASKAQARLVGGDTVELRGQIDVSGTGAAADVIATTMPAGMIPSHRAWLPTAASGGAVSDVEVTAAGALVNRRSALTGFISLDGMSYSL